MKLYHTTTRNRADSILKEGFRDSTGHYLTDLKWSGVWLSSSPLDCNEGLDPDANVVLEVELDLPESTIADYEWIEEDKTYREWLVPAVFLNRLGKPHEMGDQDRAVSKTDP